MDFKKQKKVKRKAVEPVVLISSLGGVGYNKKQGSLGPPANIYETDTSYEIELIAPGFEREDFDIELSKDFTLIIRVKDSAEKNRINENLKHVEYTFDSFSRSFQLPEDALADETDALYENGLLILRIPKNASATPVTSVRIKIH